jgi:hypothetical protein
MTSPNLGRLTTVQPRDVWVHEALNFTPWLLENVGVLGDLLGMDLALDGAEHPVGGFSLDLLGRDCPPLLSPVRRGHRATVLGRCYCVGGFSTRLLPESTTYTVPAVHRDSADRLYADCLMAVQDESADIISDGHARPAFPPRC